MSVAVLNPRDFIKDPSFSRQPLISPPKSKPVARNPNRVPRAQPNRRKRSPPRATNDSPPARSATHQKNLVSGQIRILKRGEDVTPPSPITGSDVSKPDLGLSTTDLLRPATKSVPAQSKVSNNKVAFFYAGSAFFTSPPPSSVPLPGFCNRKTVVAGVTDDATSGLRRLLRLDLQ